MDIEDGWGLVVDWLCNVVVMHGYLGMIGSKIMKEY